ncbi:hypothetical protein HMH01_05750 [Halovulum dunhuangense]|uniref:Uncharacterized protein n=1 Tax=Halovulum dunhuangense TaxID=1505036 RepID=A0A849L139_9RHOB|nr:hypothetical protein [Halovulum dunhuangense]NNU79939.1 hypothetical protein [Halovulum dunhuangense]
MAGDGNAFPIRPACEREAAAGTLTLRRSIADRAADKSETPEGLRLVKPS